MTVMELYNKLGELPASLPVRFLLWHDEPTRVSGIVHCNGFVSHGLDECTDCGDDRTHTESVTIILDD